MMGRISGFFKKRPDRWLAAGGVVFGIIIFSFLSLKIPDYQSTGIALTAACVIYLVVTWRRDVAPEFPALPWRFSAPLLNIVFLGLFSYSLLVLHHSAGGRPPGYFIAVALMSALVAVEAATMPPEAKSRHALALVKIIFIALSLRWSLYYVFPGSYFGTDPWRNAAIFSQIIDTGHISPEIGGYYYMPVQHFLVSATAQLTGLGVREAMLLSIGLLEVLSLLFIFLLGRQISDARFGLLAALLLAVNNLHIIQGWWLVAQTAGIALVSLVLYLIFTPQYQGKAVYRALTIFILIMVIITHSVSSFVMLVVLLTVYAGNIVYRRVTKTRQSGLPANLLIIFAVALLGYWLYIAGFFPGFLRMISGVGAEFNAAVTYTPSLATSVNPLWADINRLGNLFYYGLATVGLLVSLNPKNITASRFNLVFAGILLAGLVYMVFTVFYINVMIGRWFIFLDIILAVPVAIGMMFLVNSLSARWAKLGVLSAATLILAFLMITNTSAAFDSPIYPAYMEDRTALTVPEMSAAATISAISSDNIVMDYEHSLALAGRTDARVVNLSSQDVQNHFKNISGLLVLRQYAADKVFIALGAEGIYKAQITYDPYRALESQGFSRVYDNGPVRAYSR
jgi:hypothetical protein